MLAAIRRVTERRRTSKRFSGMNERGDQRGRMAAGSGGSWWLIDLMRPAGCECPSASSFNAGAFDQTECEAGIIPAA
jgi:hypothetical protein